MRSEDYWNCYLLGANKACSIKFSVRLMQQVLDRFKWIMSAQWKFISASTSSIRINNLITANQLSILAACKLPATREQLLLN